MTVFSILELLLSAVNSISKYMADKQLLEAGEHKAIAENNEKALYQIKMARLARASVKPDGVQSDPDNLD